MKKLITMVIAFCCFLTMDAMEQKRKAQEDRVTEKGGVHQAEHVKNVHDDSCYWQLLPVELKEKIILLAALDDQPVLSLQTLKKIESVDHACHDTVDNILHDNKLLVYLAREWVARNHEKAVEIFLAAREHGIDNIYGALLLARIHRQKAHTICACGERFNTGQELINHMNKIHSKGAKIYFCSEHPDAITGDFTKMLDHYQQQHTYELVEIPCEQCPRTFSHYAKYKEHAQSRHGMQFGEDLPLSCPCGARFKSAVALKEHISSELRMRSSKKD